MGIPRSRLSCPYARARACAAAASIALAACHRTDASIGPSKDAPSAVAVQAIVEAGPPRSFILPGASRTLQTTTGGPALQTALYVRRDGDDVWAFGESAGRVWPSRLHGTIGADGGVALGPGGRAPAVMTLRARSDGTIELARVGSADAGHPSALPMADDDPWSKGDAIDRGFEGTIGETIAFRAQLHKAGPVLTGYYRYPRSRTDLKLSGQVERSGAFVVTEANDQDVVTGRWTGAFISNKAAAGVWSSADGSRKLPFTLGPGPDLDVAGTPDVEAVTVETDGGYGCTNTRTRSSVSGLTPASRNAKINAKLLAMLENERKSYEEVTCERDAPNLPWWTQVSVTVSAQAPGFMALTIEGGAFSGGVFPSSHGRSCALLDTQTAELVDLTTILGPKAVDALTKDVLDQLTDFLTDSSRDVGDGGLHPPIDSTHVCYAGPRTLTVQYGPYEVTPFAHETPQFEVDTAPLIPLMPASAGRKALFGP